MKIIRLEAENIKRLRAVRIDPTGNVVQITGRNGQGKTSILDALWWALSGQAAIQGQPIRSGENRARIRLDLGEIVVERRFKRQEDGEVTTELRVENAEGVRYGSPQRMLDALFGELTFDPLAFARMTPKEQFETLRRFVPGVDFAAIDAAQQADYDRRTTLNRQAKEARAQAAGLTVPVDAPTFPVDESGLVAEMARAAEHNSKVVRLASQAAARADRIAQLRAELGSLTAEAEAAAPIPASVDVVALEHRITAAHRANEAYALLHQHVDLVTKADELEQKSEAITEQM
ncbi:MAG: ATP-binding protein, partial [Bryobacteraceae bacterium]